MIAPWENTRHDFINVARREPTTAILALTALTAAVSAAGAVSQGRAQKKMAQYNADVLEEQGRAAKVAARVEENKNQVASSRFRSKNIASISAGGGTLEGSPLLALEESAANSELDNLMIRHSGSVDEARARSQASLQRMQGEAAQTAGNFSAAGSLLGGATKFAMIDNGYYGKVA